MTAPSQINQAPARDSHANMPVGEILRRTRVHYGQSIVDVENVLRIRAVHLTALENGKSADLPARVYAIGFLRAYSEYLGLDGEKMVTLFKSQSVGSRARPELNFPVAASDSKLPGMLITGVSLAAIILTVSLFSIFHHHAKTTRTQEEIPPVSAQMKNDARAPVAKVLPAVAAVPVIQAAAVSAAGAVNGAAPAPLAATDPANRIVIDIKDTTWLEIRNASGKAIISRVLNPGDKYLVPNEDGLILATGNIGGLDFIVDGKAVPPLGNQGDVARGIKLDPDAMAGKSGKPGTAAPMAQPAPAAEVEEQSDAAWQSSIHQSAPAPPPVRHIDPTDEAYKPKRARPVRPDYNAPYKPSSASDPTYAQPQDQAQPPVPANDRTDPYSRLPNQNGDLPYGTDVE